MVYILFMCYIFEIPGLNGKESACNTRDTGNPSSISGSERSPGGGNGNLLQYACLGNHLHRGV